MSAKHTPVETFDCAGCGSFCYGGYHMEADKGGLGDYVKAEDYRTIEAQRDELLAALIEFRDGGPAGGQNFDGWHDSYAPAIEKARAAIAKVTT